MMFPGMGPDMMSGYFAWWTFGSFLFWTALIGLGIVLAVRLGRREDSAKRILDERLAKGEIDAEEYRSRRALLEH